MSRLMRVALAALLIAVPLLTTAVHPAMAQSVISVEPPTPLGGPSRAGSVDPAATPSASTTAPTDGQPTVEVVSAAEPAAVADTTPAPSATPDTTPDTTASTSAPIAAPTTYVVRSKDTLFSIARRHGVSVDALLWANGLTDANVVKEGQRLTIPPSSGTLYVARQGDTLESVAKANSVSTTGIATVNGLAEGAGLTEGQTLLIPAPRQPGAPDPTPSPVAVSAAQVAAPVPVPDAAGTASPPATPTAAPAPAGTPAATASPTSLVSAAGPTVAQSGTPTVPTTGPPSVTVTTKQLPKLEWPLSIAPPKIGITTRFSPGHRGIDIGAPAGTPIKAMAAGVVKRADKGENSGYGWLVAIDHGDDVTTWYAHLSQISVSVGDKVQTGQQVGLAGSTGRSTGPHLHFEVRIGETRIDPLVALPK